MTEVMGEKAGKDGPASGIRILLVDDEKEFVETLRERLELRGLAVAACLNCEEAMDRLDKKEFDVVVLDIRMPGVNGIDTLRLVKERRPIVEVILLTGHASVETAIEGMKLGAFDYLLKPVEADALLEKIRQAHKRKADHEERIRKAEIDRIVKRRGW